MSATETLVQLVQTSFKDETKQMTRKFIYMRTSKNEDEDQGNRGIRTAIRDTVL